MENTKYYWLKLKKDFFKRHDIQIIESMPNGKDYILFYLKLLCESVDHNGNLRFSERIPYNEQMLSTITNTNVDIVRSAIKIFTELHMMDIMDDGTYYMSEVNKMLGGETAWAEKKREYRKSKGEKVLKLSSEYSQGVRQEKESDVENATHSCPKKDNSRTKSAEIYKRIIDYLNNKCGTRYRANTPNTQKHINARFTEGYTEEDFYAVIDKKYDEWAGSEQERYLRPDTLFGTKFESYLNQKIVKRSGTSYLDTVKNRVDEVDSWVE